VGDDADQPDRAAAVHQAEPAPRERAAEGACRVGVRCSAAGRGATEDAEALHVPAMCAKSTRCATWSGGVAGPESGLPVHRVLFEVGVDRGADGRMEAALAETRVELKALQLVLDQYINLSEVQLTTRS